MPATLPPPTVNPITGDKVNQSVPTPLPAPTVNPITGDTINQSVPTQSRLPSGGGGSSRNNNKETPTLTAKPDLTANIEQPTKVDNKAQQQFEQAQQQQQVINTVTRTQQVSALNLAGQMQRGTNIIESKLRETGQQQLAEVAVFVGGGATGFVKGGADTIRGLGEAVVKLPTSPVEAVSEVAMGVLSYPATVAGRAVDIAINPTPQNVGTNIGTTAGEIWTGGKIGAIGTKAVKTTIKTFEPIKQSNVNIENVQTTTIKPREPTSDITLLRKKAVESKEQFVDTLQPIKSMQSDLRITSVTKGDVGGVVIENVKTQAKGESVATGDTASVTATVKADISQNTFAKGISGKARKATAKDVAYEAKILRDIGSTETPTIKQGDLIIESPSLTESFKKQTAPTIKQTLNVQAVRISSNVFDISAEGAASPKGIKTLQADIGKTTNPINLVKAKPVTKIVAEGQVQVFGSGKQYGTRYKGITAQQGAGLAQAVKVTAKGKSRIVAEIISEKGTKRFTVSRQRVKTQKIDTSTVADEFAADYAKQPKQLTYQPYEIVIQSTKKPGKTAAKPQQTTETATQGQTTVQEIKVEKINAADVVRPTAEAITASTLPKAKFIDVGTTKTAAKPAPLQLKTGISLETKSQAMQELDTKIKQEQGQRLSIKPAAMQDLAQKIAQQSESARKQEQRIKPAYILASKSKQQQQIKQVSVLELQKIPKPILTPINRIPTGGKKQPLLPPPLLITGKFSPPARKLSKSYAVEVRRRGRFNIVGTNLTKSEAVNLGASRVRSTAAATFRLKEIGTTPRKDTGLVRLLSDFYQKGEKFIQKAKYRISSIGEKQEIKPKRRRSIW